MIELYNSIRTHRFRFTSRRNRMRLGYPISQAYAFIVCENTVQHNVGGVGDDDDDGGGNALGVSVRSFGAAFHAPVSRYTTHEE